MEHSNLRYFTQESKIYPGANKQALQKVESWIDMARDGTNVSTLAMFGPASTGKTFISDTLSKILKVPIIKFNGVSVTTNVLFSKFKELSITPSGVIPSSFTGDRSKITLAKQIIFIDEAHCMSVQTQSWLLTFLESRKIMMTVINKIMDCSNLIFIFATTDSSKLLQPLVTRCYNVTLSQYTTEDVAKIIQCHYPKINLDASLLTAKIAKNIPREALTHATIALSQSQDGSLSKEDTLKYLASIGLDENGLDSTDRLLVQFLKESYHKAAHTKEYRDYLINLEIIKQLSKKQELTFNEAIKKKKAEINIDAYNQTNSDENSVKYLPRSRQDISLGCKLYDMRDLEIRLSYLEFLNMIEKTSRGIKYVG